MLTIAKSRGWYSQILWLYKSIKCYFILSASWVTLDTLYSSLSTLQVVRERPFTLIQDYKFNLVLHFLLWNHPFVISKLCGVVVIMPGKIEHDEMWSRTTTKAILRNKTSQARYLKTKRSNADIFCSKVKITFTRILE